MEEQAGEEGGSLFEGMDFVLSVEDPAPQTGDSLQTHTIPADSYEYPQKISMDFENTHTISGTQDDDLFTGLSMSSGFEAPSISSFSTNSFKNIMAAYEDRTSIATPTPTKVVSVSTKTGSSGRRKKRSVRIGYGRETEDTEEREAVLESARSSVSRELEVARSSVDSIGLSEVSLHSEEFMVSVSTSEVSCIEKETVVETSKAVIETMQEVSAESVSSLDDKTAPKQQEVVSKELQNVKSSGEEKPDNAKESLANGEEEIGESLPKEETVNTEEEVDGTTSFEARLETIKQGITKRLQELEKDAEEANKSRKLAAQKRRKAAQELSAASSRRKELESELETACEREDFELADKLSQQVADAEKELGLAENRFKESELQYDSAALKLEEIVTLKISIEEQGAAELETLREEAEAAADSLKEAATELARKEKERLSEEEEQLEMKNTQCVLRLRELEEAKAELDKVVGKAVEPEVQERSHILEERDLLVQELEELMEKVKLKQAEIAKRDELIMDLDTKIASGTVQFADKQSAIEEDTKAATCLLEELESEAAAIKFARKKVEEELAVAERESQDIKTTAESAVQEARSLSEALERRRKAASFSRGIKEKKLELMKKEEELLSEAQDLRVQASAARSSLQELSATKLRLQQEISSAKQKIAYLEKRGPELEAEKRLAAAARNFKEAARLSSEAKALQADKEAATGELEKSSSDLHKLEEDIEARVASLAEIDSSISIKEKEVAQTCYKRLRLVAVAARDEREIALELEDYEEAESLQAEAEAADSEADELQRIHQFHGDEFDKVSDSQVSNNAEKATEVHEGES